MGGLSWYEMGYVFVGELDAAVVQSSDLFMTCLYLFVPLVLGFILPLYAWVFVGAGKLAPVQLCAELERLATAEKDVLVRVSSAPQLYKGGKCSPRDWVACLVRAVRLPVLKAKFPGLYGLVIARHKFILDVCTRSALTTTVRGKALGARRYRDLVISPASEVAKVKCMARSVTARIIACQREDDGDDNYDDDDGARNNNNDMHVVGVTAFPTLPGTDSKQANQPTYTCAYDPRQKRDHRIPVVLLVDPTHSESHAVRWRAISFVLETYPPLTVIAFDFRAGVQVSAMIEQRGVLEWVSHLRRSGVSVTSGSRGARQFAYNHIAELLADLRAHCPEGVDAELIDFVCPSDAERRYLGHTDGKTCEPILFFSGMAVIRKNI